jgi:hypothetical protein
MLVFINKNESPPIPQAPERRIPLLGFSCNLKVLVAFILGVLSFLLMFVLGAVFLESGRIGAFAGECAFCIDMGACFFISQYFLSRGNPQALLKVWPLIIAMNFMPLCAVILCLVLETKGSALGMLLVTAITLACSYAGATLAARTVHSRAVADPTR